MEGDCGYCYQAIKTCDYLECIECEQYVHVKCLKRPGTPGDFSGDVFFQFKCVNCTVNGIESFEREKLPWAVVVALSIYNLSINSTGLSHHGFYHWRTHISHFIDKNWTHLMVPSVQRRKKWTGTISGTLSHNSPALFTSGVHVFNETGWWKLTHNITPAKFYELFKKIRKEKGNDGIDIEGSAPETPGTSLGKRSRESSEEEFEENPPVFSRTLPYMGCIPHNQKTAIKTEIDDFFDFMEPSNQSDMLDDIDMLEPSSLAADIIPSFQKSVANKDWTESLLNINFDEEKLDSNLEDQTFAPRVIQVTNYQDSAAPQADFFKEVKKEEPSDEEDEDVPYETRYPCKKSLFKVSAQTVRPSWEVEEENDEVNDQPEDFAGDKNIDLMTEYEENETYKRLKAVITAADTTKKLEVPAWIRRYYRKLCVRRTQRSLGKPVFDIDTCNKSTNVKKKSADSAVVLDRYHQLIESNAGSDSSKSLQARLAGSYHYEMFVSPYRGRVLHPFIYRDKECLPPWVKLMCELQLTVNDKMPSRASIDYCYVRPQHIAAVNALLQRLFWPGIDMSECLSYPDFSVVALYKKLVVGCAFLVPDVGHNTAYISFMAVRPGWQRSGIAQFMLYHLTQTCMGKDITLHVSATNSAICLYQKFGFKIEEFILDFYEHFLPFDSTQSKHAFLLRMER